MATPDIKISSTRQTDIGFCEGVVSYVHSLCKTGYRCIIMTTIGKEAGQLWHQLIPGVAITVQTTLEVSLNVKYGTDSATCNKDINKSQFIWRTLTFFVSLTFGMVAMSFERAMKIRRKGLSKKRFFLILLDFLIVVTWLFATSDFPLVCWLTPRQGPDEQSDVNNDAQR